MLKRSAMPPLSPEQQTILTAIEQVEKGVQSGAVVWEGGGDAMRRFCLVRKVCEHLRLNGHETTTAIYDVLRMRDEGGIPKKTT